MRRIVGLLALALSVAAAGSAAGQEGGEQPDPKARGQALLGALSGCDEALLGTTRFGYYYQGFKRVGEATVKVERAPAGSGAVYKATTSISMAFGPIRSRLHEEVLLDEKLALVSASYEDSEEEGEFRHQTARTLRREGTEWVAEQTIDGQRSAGRLAAAGPNHWDMTVMLLLVRKLDLSRPGSYELGGVHFTLADEGEPPADGSPAPGELAGERRRLVLRVEPAAEVQHRGKGVQAHVIHVERDGKEPLSATVTADRELIEFGGTNAPVRLIAGTAEEVAADLPRPPRPAEQLGPHAAVVTYLEVLGKLKPVDALDGVFDWGAIYQELGADSGLTQGTFVEAMKEDYTHQPPLVTQEMIELTAALLEVSVQGDTAEVRSPGVEGDPYLLRRAGGTWRITHFPR